MKKGNPWALLPIGVFLLIYLGLAKVPLQKWYKFILPLHGLYFILEFVFLFIAVQTGYGPL